MINTVKTKFSFVEVWFTDQIIKTREIEDNVNLTLIIGQLLIIKKMRYSIEPKFTNMLKVMAFCHLQKSLVINMIKN